MVSTLEAAIAKGHVDTHKAYANAYVVFANCASAAYALQLNMREVSRPARASIIPRSGRHLQY